MKGCVYELRHVPKRSVYVGSTVDPVARERHWRNFLLRLERGESVNVSPLFNRTARYARVSDWSFVVVEAFDEISEAGLAAAEGARIAHVLSDLTILCLNVKRRLSRYHGGSVRVRRLGGDNG